MWDEDITFVVNMKSMEELPKKHLEGIFFNSALAEPFLFYKVFKNILLAESQVH